MRRRLLAGICAAALLVGAAPAFGQTQFQVPGFIGSYCMAADSGTMAAGITANQPIFSYRYGGANQAFVRKVLLSVGNGSTAFTAGVLTFDLFVARAFTASDTGGTASTLTGNNGKLKTAYATTALSDFRIAATGALTAGTRTLDATQIASVTQSVPNTAGNNLLPTVNLLPVQLGETPLNLVKNEGLVLQENAVPATGTWVFSVMVCWDEATVY